jgi:hypothetical protein
LWVFPEGNEKFPIRAIRSGTDEFSATHSAYRMAGMNAKSMKVYYFYDDHGNVYPVLSIPPEGFVKAPHKVHQENLTWRILRARDWGFDKIYLHTQLLYEKAPVSPHAPPTFNEQEKQNFLNQRKEIALSLTKFAEEQGIDLLDPFGAYELFPLEVFMLYKNLLPELRQIFNGKFVVGWVLGGRFYKESGWRFPEYVYADYTGFDYLTPRFSVAIDTNSPSELGNTVTKAFELSESLRDKYGVGVFPTWVASLANYGEYDAFFDNFDCVEDAKIWLLKTILVEASKREVVGVSTYDLEFIDRLADVHGFPYSPFWRSKRPLETVASYFHHPWNVERERSLRVLEHAELATSTLATRCDRELASWAFTTMRDAIEAYRSGDFTGATSIAGEILKEASKLDNPLNIKIDGYGGEWKGLDPIYFNVSQRFLRPGILWYHGDSFSIGGDNYLILKKIKNLKSVYAVNDPENLYLMLEFYGPPPTQAFKNPVGYSDGPNIGIDISGNWSHQEGKEFQVILSRRGTSFWSKDYIGTERIFHRLRDLEEVAYGDVIEVKIPLQLIGNPKNVNMYVYWQDIAPWGDMEVQIVDWGIE